MALTVAKAKRMESSLSGVAKRVYNSVPISEVWTIQKIVIDVVRQGGTKNFRIIQGCLNTLKEVGLIHEPESLHFIRIPVKAPNKRSGELAVEEEEFFSQTTPAPEPIQQPVEQPVQEVIKEGTETMAAATPAPQTNTLSLNKSAAQAEPVVHVALSKSTTKEFEEIFAMSAKVRELSTELRDLSARSAALASNMEMALLRVEEEVGKHIKDLNELRELQSTLRRFL